MSSSPVCILGMHRSHTSMVAQLLMRCGLYLGPEEELYPASPDNADGHFEDLRFVKINEEILRRFKGAYDHPPSLPPGWAQDAKLDDLRSDAAALAHAFEGHEPWGWKDPRNSLTLEFWLSCVPDLKAVMCVRHPAEVAFSLASRRAGSHPYEQGLEMWRSYNEGLLGAPGERSLVTHTASFFFDAEAELRRVAAFAGLETSPNEIAAAAATIKRTLTKSHLVDLAEAERQLPQPLLDLYDELCKRAGPVYQRMTGADQFAIDTLDKAREQIKALQESVVQKAEAIQIAEREAAACARQNVEMKAQFDFASERQRLQIAELQELGAELERIRSTRWWRLHDRLGKLLKIVARR